MTVSTTANSATWTGNGATSTFTYSFYIPATASYSVVQTDTSGNQTTLGASAYTITGIGSVGGTLTLNSGPLTTGYRLTLARSVPLTQPTSLSNQGGLWPTVVEQAIDNVVLQVQQLSQQYGSAIAFNPADTTGPIPLPVASTRAGNLLAFDQAGQVTVVSLPAAASAGTTYPAAVSTALAQTPTGTGALVLQNSGALTNPVVGTQSPSDNSTKAASTAYVTAAVAAGVSTAEAVAASALSAQAISMRPTAPPKNLVISVTSSTALSVAADLAALTNSFGASIVEVVSSSISTATTGLNGLDSGTVAASTWYAVWVVSNGTITGAVLSLSGTAPNAAITSTYPYIARVGWVRTNSSGYLVATIQKGRRAQYIVGGPNLSALPTMASGTATAGTAIAVGAFVPTTATFISVIVQETSGSLTATLAPNASYAQSPSIGGQWVQFSGFGVTSTCPVTMMLESTNIYWGTTGTGTGYVFVTGWEDNI